MLIRSLAVISLAMVLGACGPSETSGPDLRTDSNSTPTISTRDGGAYEAPDFRVRTFEGDEFHLAAHQGTPVVLNFWESW